MRPAHRGKEVHSPGVYAQFVLLKPIEREGLKLDRLKSTWVIVFLAMVLVVSMGLIVGCGGGDETTTTSGVAGESTTTLAGDQPVAGGTLNYYINEPAFIDPVNLQESEGTQVGNAVFDSLVAFDPKTSAVIPAAAETWEANADATVWTFHLVAGAKFQDGTPVTAADFKYAWERICNPVNKSEISYHLAAVKGYAEMQAAPTATELSGVKVSRRQHPGSDARPSRSVTSSTWSATRLSAPVPKEEVEKDPEGLRRHAYRQRPLQDGRALEHDQYIKVVRFDDYYGDKALLDGVDFKIFKDEETAFLEFQAGNLDFTHHPVRSGEGDQWPSSARAPTASTVYPGKQVADSDRRSSIYYVLINNDGSHPQERRPPPGLLPGHQPTGHRRHRV